MSYKAVGFDLGGVVITYSIPHQMDYIAAKLGTTPQAVQDVYHRYRPRLERGEMANQEFWTKLIHDLHSEADPITTSHYWDDDYIKDSPQTAGMVELVDRVKANGYKVGMLSNIDHDHAEINRTRGIFEHFDLVLLSDELHHRKPEPAAFQALAEGLGVELNELVFIDDLPENVAGATAAGVHGVQFESYSKLLKEFDRLGIRHR